MKTRLFVIITYLALFSDAQAATCPANFANLTTCNFMNGWPALGTGSQITYLGALGFRSLDAQMNTTISVGLTMSKDTTACRAVMTQYSCISTTFGQKNTVNGIIVPTYATPCNNNDGTPMKPCRDWCLEIYRTCTNDPTNTPGMSAVLCSGDDFATTNCYGNAGVAGMRPGSVGGAASSGPHSPYVVLPIAVVAASLSAAR